MLIKMVLFLFFRNKSLNKEKVIGFYSGLLHSEHRLSRLTRTTCNELDTNIAPPFPSAFGYLKGSKGLRLTKI